MSYLGNDVARCTGRIDTRLPELVQPECLKCLRRTDPPDGDYQTWFAGGIEDVCEMRIPPDETLERS